MPDLTPNINLKKPIWDKEPADIRIFNENMDNIDEKITNINENLTSLDDKKFDKAGGTITDDVVMQKDLIVNGTVSTNSLILGGYTIVIE